MVAVAKYKTTVKTKTTKANRRQNPNQAVYVCIVDGGGGGGGGF
jgi:hypothetical protein